MMPHSGVRRHRTLIWLAGVGALLIALLGIVSWRLDSILNRYKDRMLPRLTALLGRPVTLGRISTTVLRGVGARVEQAAIAGDPQSAVDKDPLLVVKTVRVRVAMLPALLSLGKKITVPEAVIDGLTVTIVRYPDGSLNVDHVKESIEQASHPSAESSDERANAVLEGLTVKHFELRDARVRFIDAKAGGAPVEISDIDLVLRNVSMHEPFDAVLSAAVLAAQRNLSVTARFVPQEDQGVTLERVKLQLQKMSVTPLAPLLARFVSGIEAAQIASDIDCNLGAASPGGAGPTTLKGSVQVEGARFAGATKPLDLALDVDLTGDVNQGELDIRKLHLGSSDLALEGQGKLHALYRAPRMENFFVRTRGLDFDRVRGYYPRLDQTLGAVLHGPASLELVGQGTTAEQQFKVSIDLTPTSIEKAKTFQKPSGIPLRIVLGGNVKGEALDLSEIKLQVADLAVSGKGSLAPLSAPRIKLDASGKTSDLGGLARLLPPVAAALPTGKRVQGALAIAVAASGTANAWQARADVQLNGAALRVPSATIVGSSHFSAKMESQEELTNLAADADLNQLELSYLDLIHKRAGIPLSLNLRARRTPTTLEPTFVLSLASLEARGQAKLVGKRDPLVDATVSFPPFDVAALETMLPSLHSAGLPPVRLGADIEVHEKMNHPETLRAEMKKLKVTAGKSDLSGTLRIANLVHPVIDLHASSNYLDLEDLLPTTASTKNKKPMDLAPLGRVSGTANLVVAKGRAARIAYENLDCELLLDGGRATAKKLEVRALSGTFSGSGTTFDLAHTKGPFHLVGQMSSVDVDSLIGQFLGISGAIKGRLSGQADLRGLGTTPAEFAEHLDGILAGTLTDADFLAGDLVRSLTQPLASRLPFAPKLNPEAVGLKDKVSVGTLKTNLRITQGGVTLSSPIQVPTRLGPLELTGKMMLSGALDLVGKVNLTPVAASSLVGNMVKMTEPVPVQLHIGGTLSHPAIVPTELDSLARVYLGAYAKTAASRALETGAGKAGKAVLDKLGLPSGATVPSSTEEARAAADKVTQDAQRRVDETAAAEKRKLEEQADAARKAAEQHVREEADKSRREAEQKLKQQGADRLKEVFGR